MIFLNNKVSDFKIISVTLISILIFFTIYFFRFLPINLLNLSLNDIETILYNLISTILAIVLTFIFFKSYLKKDDKELLKRYKSIGTGLGVILLYFFFPYLQSLPFHMYGLDTNNIPLFFKIIYLISFYILMGSIIILIYHKKISQDFKDFKKNSLTYFNKYLKYWLIGLFIMMISNLMIMFLFNQNTSNNEQAIMDTFNISPIYIFFSAVIYAPIVEELVFRYSFKKIFSHKWVFILLSGLVFGSLHVFNNFTDFSDLLYIIPYSAPGVMFAYMLEKSDNVLVPMSFHFIHNGILIALQFFILLFG